MHFIGCLYVSRKSYVILFQISLAEHPEYCLYGKVTCEKWGAVSLRGFMVANSKQPREPSGPPFAGHTSLLPMNASSVTSRLGVTSISEFGGLHRKWWLPQPGTLFPPLSDILVHLFFVNKINSVFDRRV